MREFREDRLNRLITALDVEQKGLFAELDDAYGAVTRFYHGREHIDDCLVKYDAVKDQLDEPSLVEYALWFHDAIYDARASDNEERSAQWAVTVLQDSGVAPDKVDVVERLIIATKIHKGFSTDSSYLLDIDLSILGEDPEVFMHYDQGIRKEYAHVDEVTYANARASVLRSFLNRDRIYLTDYFHGRYEEQARLNLNKLL